MLNFDHYRDTRAAILDPCIQIYSYLSYLENTKANFWKMLEKTQCPLFWLSLYFFSFILHELQFYSFRKMLWFKVSIALTLLINLTLQALLVSVKKMKGWGHIHFFDIKLQNWMCFFNCNIGMETNHKVWKVIIKFRVWKVA